jgi:hypothetical protein
LAEPVKVVFLLFGATGKITAHLSRCCEDMMTEKFVGRVALLALFSFILSTPGTLNRAFAQAAKPDKSTPEVAIKQTRLIVEEVIKTSYPELVKADIQVNTFHDDADYFRTLFSFNRFLLGRKMRYFIRVNPRLFELAAPEAGVRAIIAHELGHVLDFQNKNRVKLLRLVRLSSKDYTARFERRTDLQAIARGYAEGLKAYRLWLYRNVPAKKLAEKKRNYFSPEEIDAIQTKLKTNPSLMDHWLKNAPLKLEDINAHN